MTTHGHRIGGKSSPTYKSWELMISRCFNKNDREHWNQYGGRGITVCSQWLDFQQFLKDMGERPANLSLGRINNDGNYEPSNCRWETAFQQNRNRRNSRFLTANGLTLTVPEWAERLGAKIKSIESRIVDGWSDEKIINTPFRSYSRKQSSPPLNN